MSLVIPSEAEGSGRGKPGTGVVRWLEVVAAGVAPGVLAGVHVAGLLFFLNPHLPWRGGVALRAAAEYGLLLGGLTLLLQLPFTWKQPRRARRLLPWAITAALVGAAVLGWAHASYYAYYLPAGINRRLLKVALWLTVAALVCFYTALLHGLARRPYGRRSRWWFVIAAVLSVSVVVERREAFRPRPEPARRPPAVEGAERPRMWVVGLEAATLDAVLPLAAQGRLPFLGQALEEGAYGRLEAFTPHRPEALWTTVATGKLPARHEVLGGRRATARFLRRGEELRLLPVGIGFRWWGAREVAGAGAGGRRALAVWEILPRLEIEAAASGWPDTPGWEEAGGGGGEPVGGDLERLAAAATLGERRPEVEAVFVVLPGLGETSRRWYGGWAAAGGEETAAEAERAAERVAAHYAALDRALAGLWEGTAGPRILVVLSAYGVEPARAGLRGVFAGGGGLAGTSGGSPDGLLVLYGDGVRRRSLLTGARLVDVAPTLLYGLGLPVAQDLEGRVLTEAFDREFLARQPLSFLPSYEGLR